ncbi:DUF6153 family protein [Streptomyces aurantiogriseus]
MHSLGHPSESTHSAMSTASHSTVTDAPTSGHDPMSAPVDSVVGDHAMDTADSPSSHEPVMAMDMLSLCVAVLFGAWVLTALVRSALARRQEWPAELLAKVAAAARPNPPPRPPDLTRLSVLRL